MSNQTDTSPASPRLLQVVQTIRSRIPAWQRSLIAANAEAGEQTPDYEKLRLLLGDAGGSNPSDAAGHLRQTAEDAGTTPQAALGDHAELLEQALTEAGKWWQNSTDAVAHSDRAGLLSGLQSAQAALSAAMQHALFLTFVNDVRKGHVGESQTIDAYCHGWGLTAAQVNMVWSWLLQDPLEFDGKGLPIAPDTVNRCAYRKAENDVDRFVSATTPIWAFALVFGLVALLFAVLHEAGLTSWPTNWGWKMLVLLLFVAIGAAVHVGSRALNVNYDDPMRVYDAGNIIDWLSLRWVAVLRMYVPISVVVASLWGAGNIPTSFQKLGTALLAGYSADSFTRAALSKLQTQASQKQQPSGS